MTLTAAQWGTFGLLFHRMPDARPDLVCPIYGIVPFEALDLEGAYRAVVVATAQAEERRGQERIVSPSETDLVAALWFYGAKQFVLQHPIGPYDADIYLPDIRLDIEVDGRDWHRDIRRDRTRTRRLTEEYDVATYRIPAKRIWADPLEAARNVAWWVARRKGELARREAAP